MVFMSIFIVLLFEYIFRIERKGYIFYNCSILDVGIFPSMNIFPRRPAVYICTRLSIRILPYLRAFPIERTRGSYESISSFLS